MGFALNIQDETTSGDVINSTIIQFPAETVSVRTLIETRVAAEVEKYREQKQEHFLGLVRPKDAEEELNGFRLKELKNIDLDEQKKVALDAFKTNGFFLLVNDKQLIELDDEIVITPKSRVVFLKLIPLVGG
ncbi:hypothetical protein [Marinomonas mediterranea]|jgi:hypothetical protein|uniref:Uncharacterized protein n=1 Tax=Marinomonas mediterranea (strain ATCC 700492 / JCM 21426 / NBRC 103028 / MMB-1) TaxID=717774 RepID=F2JWJ8_MARM1|nr:hypothetical protein [Marinomonas mediterranea]ADZ90671.1 hypothetical protein Marme_1399 [Marinomonas mediterranea MMB-1]WCN08717.1 hypothetical protein GV055_07110 [Marinomonas mediterranea]WCN12765.1 hypothetical protein GV054_06910 [Marinomonas mediterranea]WCN16836.1 hypothetical protein GV053_07050 [Marinomonas mediterranea MMB-1]